MSTTTRRANRVNIDKMNGITLLETISERIVELDQLETERMNKGDVIGVTECIIRKNELIRLRSVILEAI